MAFLFLLLRFFLNPLINNENDFTAYVALFFEYAAYINTALAVFNLLPIPPLDGSRILNIVLPDRTYYKLMQYERYIVIGVMVLLFTGALTKPLSYLTEIVFYGMVKLIANIIS